MVACVEPSSTNGTNAPVAVMRVRLESRLGVEEAPKNAVLGQILALAADDRDVVYVLHRPASVTAFAGSGDVLWSKEVPGQGPGQLDRPTSVAWDGRNRLVIANLAGRRIDFWDRNSGEYVESLHAEVLGMRVARVIGPISGGGVLLAEPLFGALGVRLVTIDVSPAADLKPMLDSVVNLAPDVLVPDRVAADIDVFSDAWSPISVGDDHDNSVAVLNADGTENMLLTVRPEQAPMAPLILEAEGRGAIISLGQLRAPRRLPSGDWIVEGNWPAHPVDTADLKSRWAAGAAMGGILRELEFESSWFVFGPSGALLTESETEAGSVSHRGLVAAVDRRGRILTILQDPYPHVARWTLGPS